MSLNDKVAAQIVVIIREIADRWGLDYRSGRTISGRIPNGAIARNDVRTLLAIVVATSQKCWPSSIFDAIDFRENATTENDPELIAELNRHTSEEVARARGWLETIRSLRDDGADADHLAVAARLASMLVSSAAAKYRDGAERFGSDMNIFTAKSLTDTAQQLDAINAELLALLGDEEQPQ